MCLLRRNLFQKGDDVHALSGCSPLPIQDRTALFEAWAWS
jgi:hypothetical protein